MRTVVTGHRGLVGGAVTAALTAAGHEVVGFDRADGDDVTDLARVTAATEGADAIVHLAAINEAAMAPEELAPPSTGTAGQIFDVNVGGTATVLAAARAHGIGRVVLMSSIDVLGCFLGQGVPRYLPLDEAHPVEPKGPYASSKVAAEVLVRAFAAETGASAVILRPPGVASTEIADFLRRARAQDPESEWSPYWEYGALIDVRDLAEAVVAALVAPLDGAETLLVNGPDVSSARLTTLQLLDALMPEVPLRDRAAFESDPYRPLIDTARAREVLGWVPRHPWRAADGA